jgi:hypothetical protein
MRALLLPSVGRVALLDGGLRSAVGTMVADGGWSAKDLVAHVTHWEMALLSNLGEPPPQRKDG